MSVSTFNTADFGANIRTVDQAPTVTGTGIIMPQYKPGHVTWGDNGGEFIYVGVNLVANQVLSEGQVVVYDNNYMGALLYAASSGGTVALPSANSNIKGANCGVVRVSPAFVAPAAGVYYMWLQRAGQAPVQCNAGSVGGNLVNTTSSATPGVLDGNASAANAGARQVTGLTFVPTAAPTFTATTAVGSSTITGVNLNGVAQGVFVGQAISGTGIPAGTFIGAIFAGLGNSYPLGAIPPAYPGSLANASIQLVNAAGAPVVATAAGAATMTVTGIQEAYVNWPYVA